MRLAHLLELLHTLAPHELAEDWDRVGLLVGDGAWPIRRAMLCIDLTKPVLDEAVEKKMDLILAYHPPIFAPLERLTATEWKQRIVLECARRRIAIYSPHTALDAAVGGLNDWLCDGIGQGQKWPISPHQHDEQSLETKVVTFLPLNDVARVRAAMVGAGAGQIGQYKQCSFTAPGKGTFEGSTQTHPTIGRANRFESVQEQRLEMVCSASALPTVLASLRTVHPYEEPAIDVYELVNKRGIGMERKMGQGRVLDLDRPVSLTTLLKRIKKWLRVKNLSVAQSSVSPIGRIGVCAGAGGSLLEEAGPIDAFFTGEMRHHDVLAAVAKGITIILAGHSETERPYLKTYRQRILNAKKQAGIGGVEWVISRTDKAASRLV